MAELLGMLAMAGVVFALCCIGGFIGWVHDIMTRKSNRRK
jgi:hypothetical protein